MNPKTLNYNTQNLDLILKAHLDPPTTYPEYPLLMAKGALLRTIWGGPGKPKPSALRGLYSETLKPGTLKP